MECVLLPADYTSDDVFAAEKDSVFANAWLYAGLRRDLENHQDFLCENAGREPVIVQNFSGELKAFSNVCAHRLSAIRDCGSRGNGPLRCPYHGWTYDAGGVAHGIPFRNTFEEAELQGDRIRLRRWEVETCGELVFVRRSANGPTLAEYLGDLHEELLAIGNAVDAVISRTDYDVRANWKLWIENSVEGYHVAVVHSSSISKLVPHEDDRSVSGDHSRVRAGIAESDGSRKLLQRALAARVVTHDDYRHYFVFPNLCITSTRGLVFDVIRTVPLTPHATRVESTLLRTKFREPIRTGVVDEFYRIVDQSAKVVMNEDRAIVETVANGVAQADRRGFMGGLEDRIAHFQATYRRRAG